MAGEKKSKGDQEESNSEFDKFQRLLKDTLAVPKEELDKRRGKYGRESKKRGNR